MSNISDIKEQIATVQGVGDFTKALQQIALLRMTRLRGSVIASRPFILEAVKVLGELTALRNQLTIADLFALDRKHSRRTPDASNHSGRTAVIVITSNPGLTGQYNQEIFRALKPVLESEKFAEFFVIGRKGQEFFRGRKVTVTNFPYDVSETFGISDLQRLINLFDAYVKVTLVYSHYVTSTKREILTTTIVRPELEHAESNEHPPRFLYEPDLYALINLVSNGLRGALFQQQILDARLSQNSAQMIGMQTASDNAVELIGELQQEYNKQRRKLIDKKISEVFAGSSLW